MAKKKRLLGLKPSNSSGWAFLVVCVDDYTLTHALYENVEVLNQFSRY